MILRFLRRFHHPSRKWTPVAYSSDGSIIAYISNDEEVVQLIGKYWGVVIEIYPGWYGITSPPPDFKPSSPDKL